MYSRRFPYLRKFRNLSFLALLVMLWNHPMQAQVDIQGSWRPLPRNQDGSGMVGDIAGVPVTEGDRLRVQSWSPEDFDITEWSCRPHAWDYSLEGPRSPFDFGPMSIKPRRRSSLIMATLIWRSRR